MNIFDYKMHLAWGFLLSLVVVELMGFNVSIVSILFLLFALKPTVIPMAVAIFLSTYLRDNTWLFLLGVFIGFDLPDIDTRHSWISRRVFVPFHHLFKHRGFTHSILALIMVVVAALMLDSSQFVFAFSLGIAYLSHILGDMMYNPGVNGRSSPGVQLFFPFKKRYKFSLFYQHPTLVKYLAVLAPLCVLALVYTQTQ